MSEAEARSYLEAQGLETEELPTGAVVFRGVVGRYRRVIVGETFAQLADTVADWPNTLG